MEEFLVGEALVCKRGPENASDQYTVAVKKEGRTFASKAVADEFTGRSYSNWAQERRT